MAAAIINPSSVSAADKLTLLKEWPILRAWANAALQRDPNKVPAKTIDAYLRDALSWSGHLGDPSSLFANAEKPNEVNATGVEPKAKQNNCANKGKDAEPKGPENKGDAVKDIPERPTHFDQYRHVCPDELGEQFDTEITDFYLLRAELGAKRDQLADLVEQAMYAGEEAVEEQYSAQLSDVAQQLVNVETTLLHFWALVDVAYRYYQLNGEVMTIEDLRAESPVSCEPAKTRQRAPRTPDHTKAEIESMPEGEERDAAKAERIRKNGNFLRDKRKADNARANGGDAYDKWREQIILRAKEQEEWGETLTAVQQEIVASVQEA